MGAAELLQAYKARDHQAIRRLLAEVSENKAYAPLYNFLRQQTDDLKKRLQVIANDPEGEEGQNFKGLFFLQQHFDYKCLNVLPSHFEQIRDEVANDITVAARDIPESHITLSTGLLRYAGKLKISDKNLESQIGDLLRKKETAKRRNNFLVNESIQRKKIRNYFNIGAVVVGLGIIGFGAMKIYDKRKLQQSFTDGSITNSTTISATSSESQNQDTNEKWFENERLLSASFILGKEVTQEIKKRGNVEAELKELGLRFGNDPMQCYPSTIFDCKLPAKSITVHGDKTHDAVLFLFWNFKVGRQVYIKKNTSFYVWVNKYEEVSAAVIFGNNWDDNLDNPCGGKGFFSEDIIYAPPTTYGTVPVHFDSGKPKIKLRLRHKKLLPKQKVNQERFMYLMQDYD